MGRLTACIKDVEISASHNLGSDPRSVAGNIAYYKRAGSVSGYRLEDGLRSTPFWARINVLLFWLIHQTAAFTYGYLSSFWM